MKKIIVLATLLAIASWSFAQEVLFTAKLKKEEVPIVVSQSVEEDFPDGTMIEYYGIPVDIVEDVWYVKASQADNEKDYDTYYISLSGKNGQLHAVYDKDGNLMSEHQVLKDAPLPHIIQKAVGKHFPGWALGKDKIIMTTHQGEHNKVLYKVQLNKGNENFDAVFDANGNLVKGHQYSVHHKMMDRKKHDK